MRKRMMAKSIHIEWRKPENALERKAYGCTYSDSRVARIFIDTNQSQHTMVDTFFHELTHVFFAFHQHNVPEKVQEQIADQVGKLCSEVLHK